MSDPFEQHLLGYIKRHELASPGETLVLALSGGPDSTALALSLRSLRQALQISLAAFHLNHGLRGQESDEDESFVRHLCRRLEVPLKVARADVRRLAREQQLNLEACARQVRYSLLAESSEQEDGQVTAATGHNQDDQAETLLLRLMRGAGVEGLACMRPLKRFRHPPGLTLVRPLLDTSRLHVVDYLKRQGQDYRYDSSNSDLRLDRIWVRRRLRPLLEERINPSLAPVLARSAALLEEVDDWLGRQAEDFLDSNFSRQEDEWVLEIEPWSRLHPALQGEVLRRAWTRSAEQSPEQPPQETGTAPAMQLLQARFQQVEQMKRVAAQPSGGEVHLAEGWRMLAEVGTLRFTRRSPVPPFQRTVSVPGQAAIAEIGRSLHLIRCPQARQSASARVVLRLPEERVLVRNRRPGDRFQPAGAEREHKLKELLQEARVPRSRRDSLILLQSGDVLLWVEGLAPRADRVADADDSEAVAVLLDEDGKPSAEEKDDDR
ncbi:MAG TPA: tRNA lysidine(34) synthetase TilS [Acidobacteriota bacterium]|nr:tRNA lysidine(34) synthetase TilS [Acidobacteriota bacterium]